MRKSAVLLAAAFLLPTLATAQMKVQPQQQQGLRAAPLQKANPQGRLDSIRRIGIADANTMLKDQRAVIVDVRSKEQFDLGHIKGAINIPGSQMVSRLRELPPGKTIITYCACSAEQSSGRAVIELTNHGVKNAAALLGGWHAWQEKGLPTEKSR